jgi:predicted RNA-binding protein associated with RNAse of E/G family
VWSYVDLELDVLVDALTGSVQLEDEDEFVAACADGTISPPEAEAARLAADDIATPVRGRKGEFGRTGAARLLEAVAQGPAPIAVPP